MSKSEKTLIYVAEASKVLSKIICTELEKQKYEVRVFDDGYEVLKAFVKEPPQLLITDKVLNTIDGMELCNVLKTGSSKSDVPVIVISTDKKIFDFWTNELLANKAITVSAENIEELNTAVKELLNQNYITVDSFYSDKKTSGEESAVDLRLAAWMVNSINKSDNLFTMTKNVMSLYKDVKDLEYLVGNLFRMLYKACEYDAITLIVDSNNAKVFKTGIEHFNSSVIEEFWNICKTEFELKAKKKHKINYEEKRFIQIANPTGEFSFDFGPNEASTEKFESYYSYEIKDGNTFVGTLHLASTRKKIFNYKVQSTLDFIMPYLASILQEAAFRNQLVQQEAKIRAAFSKFVPEQVIDDFIVSDDDSELQRNNEKRNVVVLMCDIRSFTTISEINKPEDVVNFLNTYFTRMVEIVKKYGGTVDKFIGDAIMVLFGAPISYNDNAKRAVQAAIEMYAQLGSIPCSQLKFPEGISLDIGIGIHYGDVIVGQIGSSDKTNYTVIGDTVNLASRLEGLTKLYGAKIVISQAVRDEIEEDDSMNLLLLDSVKVKGKKEAVFIYRVDSKALPKDFTQAYEKGFKSYNEGAFSLAIPYFEKAVKLLPQDKAAKLMLDRCNEFAVNKPENWDGAIALTSK